ncbi:MAG: bifunctional methylenetetrahydrofolate dehydrogenase/methenyltetrahydrofolate cyclohydrolase FolD [Desulfovibrio sp.]|nr:bifunctional methylenetetrahydrofolate dehydrogenase/methenyltetrahydrofolate cyclohydrolase FolD [Desulfovibrio sp.]
MLLLDGKACAKKIKEELKMSVTKATSLGIRPPGLAVIMVGNDPASEIYVRNKELACAEIGIAAEGCHLPSNTTESNLLQHIKEFNARADLDGILVQLPLPPQINAANCLLAIHPDKDVDGFHPENAGRLTLGLPGLRPCTPKGIMELLARYKLSLKGKKAVVVGRSNIVGKPLALMLAEPLEYANATVTICHSATENLVSECSKADYLFLSVGKPRFFGPQMVKEGAVVVDVGINHLEGKVVGDADFNAIKDKVSAITPVPGGVGPMTIAMLLKNTLEAWRLHLDLAKI